jgi:hypothetical protein
MAQRQLARIAIEEGAERRPARVALDRDVQFTLVLDDPKLEARAVFEAKQAVLQVAPKQREARVVSRQDADNFTQNVLRTKSNNELVIEDELTNERIRLHTPRETTTLQLGSEQEPEVGALLSTEAHISHASRGSLGHTLTENAEAAAFEAIRGFAQSSDLTLDDSIGRRQGERIGSRSVRRRSSERPTPPRCSAATRRSSLQTASRRCPLTTRPPS